MMQILLGPNNFSKKEYINSLATKQNAQVGFFTAEDVPTLDYLTQQDLFGKPKVFVLTGAISLFNDPSIIAKISDSKNTTVFIEEKIDRRTNANKELLKNKKVEVKEFLLPHGQELNKWIADRVQSLGGKISKEAVEELAIKVGRDDARETKVGGKVIDAQEVYDLWQVDSEIKKLLALAEGREISADDVKQLVVGDREIDVFDLTNAIAEKRKDQALELLHKFLSVGTGSDEKAAVIQLNALLAEQFRNIVLVQDLQESRAPESEILNLTGWKPGRVFVMKKLAANFSKPKVLDFLNKLKALDEELKTSSTPPKVLLDLIMVQLF